LFDSIDTRFGLKSRRKPTSFELYDFLQISFSSSQS